MFPTVKLLRCVICFCWLSCRSPLNSKMLAESNNCFVVKIMDLAGQAVLIIWVWISWWSIWSRDYLLSEKGKRFSQLTYCTATWGKPFFGHARTVAGLIRKRNSIFSIIGLEFIHFGVQMDGKKTSTNDPVVNLSMTQYAVAANDVHWKHHWQAQIVKVSETITNRVPTENYYCRENSPLKKTSHLFLF